MGSSQVAVLVGLVEDLVDGLVPQAAGALVVQRRGVSILDDQVVLDDLARAPVGQVFLVSRCVGTLAVHLCSGYRMGDRGKYKE